ncbi:MAG TPA: hypothetical protein VMF89_01120, partial [Polyangiales bacterium]|nr:hypothetical protein [Polyangiales bacterium]
DAAPAREQTRRMQSAPAVPAEDPLLDELRPRRTRSRAVFGLLTALLLAAAWAATAAPDTRLWLSHQAFDVPSPEPGVAHANATVSVTATLPEPLAPAEIEPAASPPQPPAAVTPEPVKRTPRKAPATSAPPNAETPRPDPCNPFYSVDERGIRHPKPECL